MGRVHPLRIAVFILMSGCHKTEGTPDTPPVDDRPGTTETGTPPAADTGTSTAADTGTSVADTGTGTGEPSDPCDGNPDCEGALLWAIQFGDTDDQAGSRVSSEEDGSITLNGEFRGTMDLGLGEILSNGDYDSFWARLDGDGTASYAMSLGTTAYDLNIFDVGPTGVIALTGTFEGALQLGDRTLESAGSSDIALAAFDLDDGFLWSQRFGDEMLQHGGEVLVGETGDVTITGYIDAGTVDFGGGPMTVDAITCGNYMARFGPNGEHKWSQLFEGVDSFWGATIALFDDGGIALAGEVIGTINLGGEALPGGEDTDVVVARFDADGHHLWSHRFGDVANEGAWRVAIAPNGDIVIMGYADGVIDFGGGPLPAIGERDVFVARFDGEGNHVWSHRFGGTEVGEGFGLAIGPDGYIAFGGWFKGSLDTGCGIMDSTDDYDAFVSRLDESGNCTWSQSFGDSTPQWVDGIALDASGNVLVTGAFEGTMVVGDRTLTSVGGEDGFLLKLSP